MANWIQSSGWTVPFMVPEHVTTAIEFDNLAVGSEVAYTLSGWVTIAGSAAWLGEWAASSSWQGRVNARERLIVVTRAQEATNGRVIECGGFDLVHVERWTDEASGIERFMLNSIASTGVAYAGTVDEFLANVINRAEAEQALEQAIIAEDAENEPPQGGR